MSIVYVRFYVILKIAGRDKALVGSENFAPFECYLLIAVVAYIGVGDNVGLAAVQILFGGLRTPARALI